MKFVSKIDVPLFFTEDTKDFSTWNDYNQNETTKAKRRNLREYILTKEQNGTCIYCESKINIDNSHVEHIRPKEPKMYPELEFEYSNLAASCEGKVHTDLIKSSEENPETTCGHKKLNIYDEEVFLNPHEKKNISEYFKYDKASGLISPNEDDQSSERYKKADFMIQTLNLNDGCLPKARLNAIKVLVKRLQKKNKEEKKQELTNIIQRNSNAFLSFISFRFKHLL